MNTLKRGLTHQEAMEYVGVKRRTFDEVWRPQLVAMRQGACVVFDRLDLDRLFDRFKQEASGQPDAAGRTDACTLSNPAARCTHPPGAGGLRSGLPPGVAG